MSQAPEHHEPSDHELLLDLVDKVGAFLKRNGLHVLVVVLVVVLAGVLIRTAHYNRISKTNVAWTVLASLPESIALADDLRMGRPEEIAQQRQAAIANCRQLLDGPKTEAIPWTLYKLGNLQASGEDSAGAISTYERLMREYPGSVASRAAESALATALEDSGDYEKAAQTYERVAARLGPAYLVDAGRAWELAGNAASAERCYNAALTAHVGQRYENLVASRLDDVRSGRLLSAPPEFAAPEPTAPTGSTGPVLVPSETETTPSGTAAVPPDTRTATSGTEAVPGEGD